MVGPHDVLFVFFLLTPRIACIVSAAYSRGDGRAHDNGLSRQAARRRLGSAGLAFGGR